MSGSGERVKSSLSDDTMEVSSLEEGQVDDLDLLLKEGEEEILERGAVVKEPGPSSRVDPSSKGKRKRELYEGELAKQTHQLRNKKAWQILRGNYLSWLNETGLTPMLITLNSDPSMEHDDAWRAIPDSFDKINKYASEQEFVLFYCIAIEEHAGDKSKPKKGGKKRKTDDGGDVKSSTESGSGGSSVAGHPHLHVKFWWLPIAGRPMSWCNVMEDFNGLFSDVDVRVGKQKKLMDNPKLLGYVLKGHSQSSVSSKLEFFHDGLYSPVTFVCMKPHGYYASFAQRVLMPLSKAGINMKYV